MNISISDSLTVSVDDRDVGLVDKYTWYPIYCRGKVYACRAFWENGKTGHALMHRDILGVGRGGPHVDHRDGNGLNNTRQNIRLCTVSQNGWNRGKASHNTSGFKGVTWNKEKGGWASQLTAGAKHYWMGLFDDPREAAEAYDAKAIEVHGEFCITNKSMKLL